MSRCLIKVVYPEVITQRRFLSHKASSISNLVWKQNLVCRAYSFLMGCCVAESRPL